MKIDDKGLSASKVVEKQGRQMQFVAKSLTLWHKQGIVQNAATIEKVAGLVFLVTIEGPYRYRFWNFEEILKEPGKQYNERKKDRLSRILFTLFTPF